LEAWLKTNPASPEAFKAFDKAIEEVRNYFELVKGTASSDPGWYCEMGKIALAQDWNRSRFDAISIELLDRHPHYYQAVFCMVEYLAPSWYYEGASSIERFADLAVRKSEKEDG
jgi:hypothetical protein